MTSVGTRRESRERALELLYESDAKGLDPGEVIADLPLRPDDYAVELCTGVADHRVEIDSVLDRYAQRWSVSRMAAMDRAVLRLGVFELATQLGVPRGVCLSEAVELGSTYGSTDDTSKFVNGVLSAVADEVRDDGSDPWVPIEAVVFDMDGVFRHWSGSVVREFEAAHGIAPGAVAAAAFAQPLFDQAMTGQVSASEWAAAIASALAETQPGLDAAAVEGMWLAVDWTVDDEMVALLRRLHASGVRTALFSNASTHLEADLEVIGIARDFDVVANSSRLGMAKPDVDAFAAVAEMVGGDPGTLLFVDDRAENVAGAVAAGWHAVTMHGAARFQAVLDRLGVGGAASSA